MTIDLTQVLVTVIGGVFSVLGIVLTAVISKNVKDQTAASSLGIAVKNSLGAIQQAADQGIQIVHPSVTLPAGVPPAMAVGVQYVLDHAGPEAARFGLTPTGIADKINAQIGLSNIASVLSPAATSTTPTGPVAVPALATKGA